jgi:hypothetical protein
MSAEVYELREDYRREVEDRMYTEYEFPRSEVADACGVLPQDVDEMLLTYERVGWLAETSGLDVCYNAWKYIARHEDPQDFLSYLLRSMDDYGGRFPPVSVIRMKLADSKGNVPPPKPRKWTGKAINVQTDAYGDTFVRVMIDGVIDLEDGTPVTLTEERMAAVTDSTGAEAGA